MACAAAQRVVSVEGRVHVVGAGLAGLSAAVRAVHGGAKVSVYETTKCAGGRCRSFFDESVDANIDNGTHLMLSGNRDVLDYLDLIKGSSQLIAADRAQFDFLDVSSGARWSVDLGAGQGKVSLMKWMFDKRRRPPGLKPMAFVKDVRTLKRGRGKTVAACVDTDSDLYRTFWQPLCLGVLNTAPETGAAELIWAVLKETVMKGGAHAKPLLAPNGLGAALVDPALEMLNKHGADIHFQRRITSLDVEDGQVRAINFAHAAEVLNENDIVVLAVPHHAIADLLSGVPAPSGQHAILNVHFRLKEAVSTPRMLGVVGGDVQWVFRRGYIASVTLSAADAWMNKDTDAIAHALWPEVAKAIGDCGEVVPTYRVIKERRATFAATPEALSHRPTTQTGLKNVYLAGDWTDTGFPATLEGAIKSGRLAAAAALSELD